MLSTGVVIGSRARTWRIVLGVILILLSFYGLLPLPQSAMPVGVARAVNSTVGFYILVALLIGGFLLIRTARLNVLRPGVTGVPVTIPGWRMVKQGERMTTWQDVDGDALTLAPLVGFPDLADENAVRRRCRELAETMSSGLIEAAVVTAANGPAVMFIFKRLDKPAFIFTGMLVVASASKTHSVWTVVARERGTTGVREAMVTAQLINEGKLTLESYRTSWAQDPYDPTYRGVDGETLRYLSDDESYDAQFPEHPLSKVRRELRRLLAVKLQPPAVPHQKLSSQGEK